MRIINKFAKHKYKILETFETGIVLNGAEVKSIRDQRVDLSQAFAKIQNGEVYLINAYINPYHGVNPNEYDERRSRKLLMHKAQINSLIGKLSGKGLALIPVSIYFERNLIKVELGLASPKGKFDHRKEVKERDEQRKIEQELKNYDY